MKTIGVRVDDNINSQIENAAQSNGTSISEWCRDALLNQLNPPPEKLVDWDDDYMQEIHSLIIVLHAYIRRLCHLPDEDKPINSRIQKVKEDVPSMINTTGSGVLDARQSMTEIRAMLIHMHIAVSKHDQPEKNPDELLDEIMNEIPTMVQATEEYEDE